MKSVKFYKPDPENSYLTAFYSENKFGRIGIGIDPKPESESPKGVSSEKVNNKMQSLYTIQNLYDL